MKHYHNHNENEFKSTVWVIQGHSAGYVLKEMLKSSLFKGFVVYFDMFRAWLEMTEFKCICFN